MHITASLLSILLVVGLVAGYVDGIAGGGGLITLPVLLSVGVPPHMVLGTNKLAATLGVCSSALTYVKKRIFRPQLWITAIIAALFGSMMGSIAVHFMHASIVRQMIPVILIIVIIYMAIPKPQHRYRQNLSFKPPARSSGIFMGLLGFYDGFFGPGTGTFGTAIAMSAYKLDMVQASGVARFINFMSNFAAVITFIIMGNVIYTVGFGMGVTYIIGSYLGVHSAVKFGGNFIKPIFLVIATAICLRLIWVDWVH